MSVNPKLFPRFTKRVIKATLKNHEALYVPSAFTASNDIPVGTRVSIIGDPIGPEPKGEYRPADDVRVVEVQYMKRDGTWKPVNVMVMVKDLSPV